MQVVGLLVLTTPDVTFIGTPTNGANGNVTNCNLPGKYHTTIIQNQETKVALLLIHTRRNSSRFHWAWNDARR